MALADWLPTSGSGAPSRHLGQVATAFIFGWGVWYALVLRKAALSRRPWGPRWLAISLSSSLYRFGCWWLNFSHNAEEAIKAGTWGPGKQYVMVWHPHGAFTISALYFFSYFWARDYPGGTRGDRYVCVAPLLLRIPFLAEFLLLCHARSQDSRTFSGLLESGATVAIQPGGLAEQVATDHTAERIFFPPRLGFIRLALKHGVPLLPVYAFGENQLYKTNSWTRRLNGWFYKNLGAGTLVVLGQGGVPNSPILPNPLMLPRRGSLHIRFGEPVHLGPKEENPSDERVHQAFRLYLAALRNLFDAYKDECLPPEVAASGLSVVERSASTRR
mmetsp:Transcript_7137/g.19738  ORF Transcript_7137/g.19738 Transcript_7137/m.19738 type:complete len:330 (+) Transcript_7137:49-1038(+)